MKINQNKMKKQIKETIKSSLNAVGIGAYLFPKTPLSSLDKLEYLKTCVNDKPLDIILRANGSDKHVFNQIFIIEEYKSIVEFMLQFPNEKNRWNIIDGGANIGLTSLYFLKNLPNSTVISIEPDKDNYEMIKKNMGINHFSTNGNIINAGLWSKNALLTTERSFRDGEDWSITVKETTNVKDSIKAFSINNIIDTHFNGDIIDLLKLDIEGSEKYIFEAEEEVSRFLAKMRFVIIEIHDEMNCRETIYRQLTRNNFKYFNVGESTIGFNMNFI